MYFRGGSSPPSGTIYIENRAKIKLYFLINEKCLLIAYLKLMMSKQNGKQFFCPSFTLQNHFMDRKEVAMFLSKRPNGIYHLYYDQADGKR
ncbi:MAG TPA: hypothetical protein VF870_13150, partial [Ignavibacteriaceae bacterium]